MFMARQKRDQQSVSVGGCENCGRDTDVLFDGFITPQTPNYRPGTVFDKHLVALCSAFQTTPARVCLQCRPPSNLEIEEILAAAKTTRQTQGSVQL